MRVKSDKYKKFKKEHEEMMGDGCEIVPVDLYGKRVNLDKNDPTNLEKTAKDIQEVYGLDEL